MISLAPDRLLCPSWCQTTHSERAAQEAGCDVDDLDHYEGDLSLSPDMPGRVIGEGPAGTCKTRVQVELVQPLKAEGPVGQRPHVQLWIHTDFGDEQQSGPMVLTRFTTGEARSLAAMLIRYADLEDFADCKEAAR